MSLHDNYLAKLQLQGWQIAHNPRGSKYTELRHPHRKAKLSSAAPGQSASVRARAHPGR